MEIILKKNAFLLFHLQTNKLFKLKQSNKKDASKMHYKTLYNTSRNI